MDTYSPSPPLQDRTIRGSDLHATKHRSRGWIGWAIAIVAVGGLSWYLLRPSVAPPAASPPPIPVATAKAAVEDVPLYLVGIGNVLAYNTVAVKVRVDGAIDKIAFVEGQDVHEGDLLAQIDPRPFQAALAQAKANKARDAALLGNARLDLERYQRLSRSDFATRQSVDTQQAQVAQYVATVEGDQAAIDNATVQLGYTSVTAPLTGRTGVRQIDQGNIVHAADNTPIVTITQLEPISVLFTLPETALTKVRQAMARIGGGDGGPAAPDAELKVVAFDPGETTQLAEGKLALVNNLIDTSTGTVQLKATFPNRDHALWPGQFISVHVLTEVKPKALVVPTVAIQRGPDGTPFVYRLKPDSTVEMVQVRVADAVAGKTIVDSGLNPGDQVVTEGQFKIRPGTQVKPTAPDQVQQAAGAQAPGAGKSGTPATTTR